jgi:hypothetical protein
MEKSRLLSCIPSHLSDTRTGSFHFLQVPESGGGTPLIPTLGWLVVIYLASDPNERTESASIEATTTFGFPWPQILAGIDIVPAGREKSKIEDRTSIGTRTRTHPYRVCVRSSALSSSLGQRIYCRSSAFVRSKSMGRSYFVNYGSAKSSPCRSIALHRWCPSCGRLSGLY